MVKGAVREYKGERSYEVAIGGIRRDLPLVQISDHLWIASDAELILGDVELISTAARVLSAKIRRTGAEFVLTAEAKSIPLAYELSKMLGRSRFIVARKSLKSYIGEHVSRRVRSITTETDQKLLLTRDEVVSISGKRVLLLDDVVSTGGTFETLQELVKEANAIVAGKAVIWKEGPWYKEDDLIFLDLLPVFVDRKSPLFPLIES